MVQHQETNATVTKKSNMPSKYEPLIHVCLYKGSCWVRTLGTARHKASLPPPPPPWGARHGTARHKTGRHTEIPTPPPLTLLHQTTIPNRSSALKNHPSHQKHSGRPVTTSGNIPGGSQRNMAATFNAQFITHVNKGRITSEPVSSVQWHRLRAPSPQTPVIISPL